MNQHILHPPQYNTPFVPMLQNQPWGIGYASPYSPSRATTAGRVRLPSFSELCSSLQNVPAYYYPSGVGQPFHYQPQNYTVHGPSPSISSGDSSPEQVLVQLKNSGQMENRRRFKSEPDMRMPKKRGRKKKANTICSQCRLENTPEWRRGPEGSRTLCNACGLFYLKLTKRFGPNQAGTIMRVKKSRNEIYDRLVPTDEQRDEICGVQLANLETRA